MVYVIGEATGCWKHHVASDHSEDGGFTMAADHNTPALQMKRIDLAALTKRLGEHADSIENLAARPMADDMRLAAQVINRLIEEIGTAATTTNGAIAHLVDQVGWH
jgi:hypothetical protein